MRRLFGLTLLGVLGALAPALVFAGGVATLPWPHAKPIVWFVGFPAGGSADAQARLIARLLGQHIGQSVIVENRPGAAGANAMHAIAAASQDGYAMTTAVGPFFHKRANTLSLEQGLVPVALLATHPLVLVAPTRSPQPADLQALLSEVRRHPDAWSYATSGIGTPQHLAGELLNKMADTRMLHVAYKGGADAVRDVVSGQVSLGILGVTPVMPFIQSGRLKAYAVTGKTRLPGPLSHVPTMKEAGLKGYEVEQWYVLAMSDKVPAERIQRLNRWVSEIMASDAVKEALAASGSVPGAQSPPELRAFVRRESQKWQRFARDAHLQLDN